MNQPIIKVKGVKHLSLSLFYSVLIIVVSKGCNDDWNRDHEIKVLEMRFKLEGGAK